jgi:DNA-binding transcriptional LysR family regulator
MWNPVTFFNPLQEHFTSNGSGVTLSIEAYNFGDMVSALREREVDLAVTYDYVLGNQRGIVSVPLAKLEVGIIYSLAHYGRSDRDLTLDDLCDVPVLLANGASDPFYHIVDHVFASYGLSGSRRPCHRESSVIMDALCGHGVLRAATATALSATPPSATCLWGVNCPFPRHTYPTNTMVHAKRNCS